MNRSSNRAGFALPMAILLIGLMTAGLVAAFARTTAETRVIDDQSVEATAFALAQAGLDRAFAKGDTLPATEVISLPGGTATIQRIRIRPAQFQLDTAIWLFRSTGRTTARGPARPAARRDVAQLAYKNGATMQVLSSWTSLSGLLKEGVAGVISGNDRCGEKASLPGVLVPDSMFWGHDDALGGNPPLLYGGTQQQVANSIKIDWAGLSDPVHPVTNADWTYCVPGTYGYNPDFACNGWPYSQLANDTTYWPVIIVNGSSPLPSDGRGLLIVTGDLIFGGGDVWAGIVLVGGRIVDNGSGDISGAVISGLNIIKGDHVDESSKANGTKDYNYDSCKVAKAASAMAKVTAFNNAWMDNWPGW